MLPAFSKRLLRTSATQPTLVHIRCEAYRCQRSKLILLPVGSTYFSSTHVYKGGAQVDLKYLEALGIAAVGLLGVAAVLDGDCDLLMAGDPIRTLSPVKG